ncbi:MAG: glycoside hydrolase family 88 protein [Dysgonamonadaceae bacterium]|jgi:rhamnogalacturonyl hydrolase YesR|nr:glycoside hydrolase family 88 protein [Dysgonamonadaceae bacterium]
MKYLFITLSLTLLAFVSCTSQQTKENIVQNNFNFAENQLAFAITEVERFLATDTTAARRMLVVPRSIENDGTFKMVASRDWTSGFFPGSLWYMYEYTGDKKWETEARRFTAPIEREKTNGTTHDMGFKIYCSFGNGFRLTNDQSYKDIMLESAYTLITRYNPNVRAIRSWDHNAHRWQYPVIIDNMMNLELLFWAFRETGDSTFYNIAVNHAETTMKNHFRPDFSTYHVVDFDRETGETVNRHTHQGYAHETMWARGQAWAIYGYTLTYRETKNPAFLQQAKNATKAFFSHPNLPEDLIPYWDFNAPDIPNEPRDASAAAITASALYEMSTYDTINGAQYKQWADTIIENLTHHYRAEEGTMFGFLLLHSTGHKPNGYEIDVPLVYADYYFLEALLRKQKIEKNEPLF